MSTQLYFFWSGISMTIFYLLYLSLLKRETFFLLNRIYLLAGLCFSIVLPLFDLSSLTTLPKIEFVVSVLSSVEGAKPPIISEKDINWLCVFYWIGVMITSVLLLIKLVGVKKRIKLLESGRAYSFWRSKMIDKEIDGFLAIDAHEDVHVKQLHTVDILLVEMIKIFFWFNPIVYCYQRSLKLIHEYLADEKAANIAGSKKQYATMLFLHNFKVGPQLTNTFYDPSVLEARIAMLQRKRSNTYRLGKYVVCVPLIVLITVTCSVNASGISRIDKAKIEKAASFPGGFEAFSKYLISNTNKVSGKNGRVIISFIIEADGKISNIKIEKGLDDASDAEALRVIKLSPKWEAALQSGKKIRSAYQIGINFQSDNQTHKHHI